MPGSRKAWASHRQPRSRRRISGIAASPREHAAVRQDELHGLQARALVHPGIPGASLGGLAGQELEVSGHGAPREPRHPAPAEAAGAVVDQDGPRPVGRGLRLFQLGGHRALLYARPGPSTAVSEPPRGSHELFTGDADPAPKPLNHDAADRIVSPSCARHRRRQSSPVDERLRPVSPHCRKPRPASRDSTRSPAAGCPEAGRP